MHAFVSTYVHACIFPPELLTVCFFLSVETGLRWGGVKLHPYHSHRGEPVLSMFGGLKKKKENLYSSISADSISTQEWVLFFTCLSFPHVNDGGTGGGRSERRYATLPQTPPQPDWKVMALKETFSLHFTHLCDLRARHALARTHGPIKHLINYPVHIITEDR